MTYFYSLLLFSLCIRARTPPLNRWLLSRGQSKRAIVILKTFARVNKRRPAESVFQQLKVNGSTVVQVNCFVYRSILSFFHSGAQVATEEARLLVANEPVHTALDLLKTPRLRRNTIFLTLLWFFLQFQTITYLKSG